MPPYPYRLVIFDFDGTLADSFPWFLEVFDHLAERFGFENPDRSHLDELRRLGPRELLKRLKVPLLKLPAIATYAQRLQNQQIEKIVLFDGIAEVIRNLKARGVTVVVVTSNDADNVRTVLGAELSALIDQYSCGSSLFGKAAKFKGVLKAFKARPEATLSIGDELRDIEAARKVGIAVGAVTWGYAHEDSLLSEKPDHVFEKPADILNI
ncbi:HAD hydrolase-like protein [Asticcacaulis excentricus]|uniref:HAD-superfamily hydrolase, subfamily IA, variant 1 n=1 Tax=Asticcacaulis excentricus (strain ATCC 15261 / DSM 4724 / KCTC 12464 / NCIMB 9791 / VKM B-1370 / CB 48) TaxID=573065 RepID=E8RSU0_ASTEC|nr:HAD hydrolase-like protein [Asticcacaulis excentricus]ADU14561.1 HAD-superfamily hydrolase, subfamily IA, variant 1 [Asticcacaulis excentricus CB 48]